MPDLGAVARAFGLALALYLVVGLAFGLPDKPPQTVALGAILIFGVVYLIAQGLADLAPRALAWRTVAAVGRRDRRLFRLAAGRDLVSAGTLPPPPPPDGLIWATIVLALASFAVAAVAQTTFPALGRASGRGGTARAPDERPLPQRGHGAAVRPLDPQTEAIQ